MADSTKLDPQVIRSILRDKINPAFKTLNNQIDGLCENVMDLQRAFYGPANSDSSLIYKKIMEDIGTKDKGKLVSSVYAAYQWCCAVDEYTDTFESRQNTANIYD